MKGLKMNIGEKIRAKRLEQKLSQAELGEKFGVSRSYISKMEAGKRDPSDEVEAWATNEPFPDELPEEAEPYQEGFKAWQESVNSSRCPYRPGEDRGEWFKGYYAAQEKYHA
ncbi:hypothetical protein WH96_06610 [Kiloniella spongiae]|uniref:HTH cro/C1-type domain-containing protein n=1 Tax=Kiloniella spongiae TaxID=1489064 RepID=A0A0H2MG25_9PROT|nr:helix-turn-helix transcriptional regulator [Kiloniella spongiae]KLN61318.1 hypothetical protein WH96_06610 [Kiloniella spongiae]